jgi:hypothetical protein
MGVHTTIYTPCNLGTKSVHHQLVAKGGGGCGGGGSGCRHHFMKLLKVIVAVFISVHAYIVIHLHISLCNKCN